MARQELELLEDLLNRLWPICRSVAGPGFRRSLELLAEVVPTQRLDFPTGGKALDWTVPREWEARDAYLVDPNGRKRAEFRVNNLHLVSHSVPFRGRLPLAELKKHLYSLPAQPTAIPYITSYYKERWGFCITHQELLSLPEGEYEVVVDTELRPGVVSVGECVLPGRSKREVLFSTYLCHPSLANNELSGPLALAMLYRRLAARPDRKFTYRFVISAETIGTICYLSLRGQHLKENVVAGYQVTCVGDQGNFTLKRSRQGDSLADRAAIRALARMKVPHEVIPFDPGNGSDERQYCSPGYNLPVASLMRTMYSRYPEYHTSLDDREFLSLEALVGSVNAYEHAVNEIEESRYFESLNPNGEPQLGKRGLYPEMGSTTELEERVRALMWTLNFSDGRHELRAIAEKSGIAHETILGAAEALTAGGLLKEII